MLSARNETRSSAGQTTSASASACGVGKNTDSAPITPAMPRSTYRDQCSDTPSGGKTRPLDMSNQPCPFNQSRTDRRRMMLSLPATSMRSAASGATSALRRKTSASAAISVSATARIAPCRVSARDCISGCLALFDLIAIRITMPARQKRGAIAKKRRHPGRGAEIARRFPHFRRLCLVL